MDLNDLRRSRKAASDEMATAAAAIEAAEALETPDDAAVASAVSAFETAEAAFKAADVKVKRGESVEAAALAAAGAGDEPVAGRGGADRTPGRFENPADKGVMVGLMVGALAATKSDKGRAVEMLDDAGHSGAAAVLQGAVDSAGGVTIPQEQSAQVIELLKPRVVVRASGARTVPMPAGELLEARQATSATASYGAEIGAIPPSEPTFDSVQKNFRKLRCLVPLSNSLLRFTSAAMARLVMDDIVSQMALREDLAFIRGDGTSDTPVGLLNWVPGANWEAAVAGTATAAEKAIRSAMSKVEDANVAMTSPGWIMRAGTKNWLASLRDGNGNYIFPSIDASGTLKGYPIRVTSQIPDNLGVGGNEVEVYFADFAEVIIGDASQITFATSTEAAYVDGSGDTQSAFQNDLTLMRAISEHDLAPHHAAAIAGFNGVGMAL